MKDGVTLTFSKIISYADLSPIDKKPLKQTF